MRANLLWYIRLMLVLCLFVLLFLCVLYLISDRSSRQLMEETVHQQQTYLARGATMVGDEISAFWGTQVDLLQKTDAINDLATATTLQPAHYADMIKAQNALTNILGKRNDSHPFLLVLDQGDGIALSPSAIYHNMRESVENGVLSLNGLGYEAVLEFLRENANFGASLANVQVLAYKSSADGLLRENSYLSIIRKLNASSTQCDTYAIWMLGLEDLCDTLSGESDIAPFFALQKGEALLYSTDEGAPLSQIHGGVFHDSANELTYLCVEIPFVRLTAYLALNNRVVLAHLASYALLWNTLFAAFIALCAALAVMLFFYLIHPLNRLYKRVCASGSALPAAKNRQGSIFTQIESHIAEMGCDYTRLNRQLVQYRAFLHQSLLSKLLLGIRAAPSEVEALHTQLQPLDRQPFCVAIVSALWGGAPRDNRFEEALGPCLNALFAGAPCIWLDQGSAAVILECDTPSTSLAAQMEALHCALCQALASEEGACIGVGRSRTGIRNIRDSFLEARRALCEAQLKSARPSCFSIACPTIIRNTAWPIPPSKSCKICWKAATRRAPAATWTKWPRHTCVPTRAPSGRKPPEGSYIMKCSAWFCALLPATGRPPFFPPFPSARRCSAWPTGWNRRTVPSAISPKSPAATRKAAIPSPAPWWNTSCAIMPIPPCRFPQWRRRSPCRSAVYRGILRSAWTIPSPHCWKKSA